MIDTRIQQLAKNLLDHSVSLQPGENILIDCLGKGNPLVKELIKYAYEKGGTPFVSVRDDIIFSTLLKNCTEEQLKLMAKVDSERMSHMNAYISIRTPENINEMKSVPQNKMKLYNELYIKPVHLNLRVCKTKWCILKYPNAPTAQLACMSTEDFEDFYFNVCNLDYSKLSIAMDPLVELMNRTNKVRIIGPGTDLTFSIEGLPAIKCSGKFNIPDGEVFSAPVKDSVNGTVSYNVPNTYQGNTFNNICFEFKNGKIINASSNHTKELNEILNIDEGARYIGEFALGVNPYIHSPMNDILFDEKISGSFHFTPGNCYEKECNNSNLSTIHWDLVCIQTPEYGGGEIWFDDVLIRKDGLFVLDQLKCLNPENFK